MLLGKCNPARSVCKATVYANFGAQKQHTMWDKNYFLQFLLGQL